MLKFTSNMLFWFRQTHVIISANSKKQGIISKIQMEESKPRIKNIVVIILIILAVVITGVAAYYIRNRSTDSRSKANVTKPIKVYFEPKVTSVISGNIVETNIYFENNQGEEVTGGTVVLKFPSDALTFNKTRSVNSQTQANAECKANGFALEGLLDSADNGDGTLTMTRFAPFTDPSFIPPSGKFCFGTISFTLTNSAVPNIKVEFAPTAAWKIVGPNTTYEHSFGDASGLGTFVSVTADTNPTTTATPVATSTPRVTTSPTTSKTPTDEPTGTTTATPTPTSSLPNTAAPASSLLLISAGMLLVMTAVYVYTNRLRA